MLSRKTHFTANACLLVFLLALCGGTVSAAQDRSTGGLKGKVHVESGAEASDISVIVREGEREIAKSSTNGNGEFVIRGLPAGLYGLTFRKPGLSVGTMEKVEVRAGKMHSLKDKLFLPLDEGSIAFLRGSIFNAAGQSVAGARVELSRVLPDGTLKKVDSRITNSIGAFSFRLKPERATYSLHASLNGLEATEQTEIDGASIFRIALSLAPAAK